jgi:hypothetical protein
MPERWQVEVRKLRTLDMPPTVRERMEGGPTGEDRAPRGQRVLAAGVALAVFVAAGFLVWVAFRPSRVLVEGGGSGEVVATFSDAGPAHARADAVLTFRDRSVEGATGSYCWAQPDDVYCVDTYIPRQMDKFLAISRGSELFVSQGSELIVQGTAESVEGSLADPASPLEPVATLDLMDGSAPLNAAPGRYLLLLVAHWPQGDVPFYFAVEVVPES